MILLLQSFSAGISGTSHSTRLLKNKQNENKQAKNPGTQVSLGFCRKSTEPMSVDNAARPGDIHRGLAWDRLGACLTGPQLAPWLFLPDVARAVGQGTPSAEMRPCPVPEASGWLRSTTSGLCESHPACSPPSGPRLMASKPGSFFFWPPGAEPWHQLPSPLA